MIQRGRRMSPSTSFLKENTMEKFEQIFSFINEHTEKYAKEQDLSFLESALMTLSNIIDGEIELPVNRASKEEMRKAIQLTILKGIRKESQPNHQMTPDTLGYLLGYFLEQFLESTMKERPISILDPAVGTGNLLFTVMNMFDGKVQATGVEVDDLLIRLASETAELLEQPVTLYHQDALQKLFVDPVDAVVCDLPVGFYPNEEVALDYELCAKEGMSFAHYLLMEQSIRHTKPGGYLFFLIPYNLFETDEAKQLHSFLKKHVYIQAVIQLPETMFKSKLYEKSIFILQKKDEGIKQPREVLLAKVPQMSNKQAMTLFFEKVQIWKKEQK